MRQQPATCYTILSMLLWGFGLDAAPVDSCSHGERSIILLKRDIFLHHVVAQSVSACMASALLPQSPSHHHPDWTRWRMVLHMEVCVTTMFAWECERVIYRMLFHT